MKWFRNITLVIVLLVGVIFASIPLLVSKGDIEKKLSIVTQKEITFKSYGLSLFPILGLKVENLTLTDSKKTDIHIKKLVAKINPLELLDLNALKINTIYLFKPTITLKSSQDKKVSKKIPKDNSKNITLLDIETLHIENASITYDDIVLKDFNAKLSILDSVITIDDFNLKEFKGIKKLQLKGNLDLKKNSTNLKLFTKELNLNTFTATSKNKTTNTQKSDYSKLLKGYSASSHMKIDKLLFSNTELKNIDLKVSLKNNLINIKPAYFELYNNKAEATALINLQKKEPKVSLNHRIKQFDLTTVDNENKNLQGKIDIELKLNFKGDNKKRVLSTLNGYKKVTGKGIHYNQYNIDEVLDMYEETKKVNLLDIGAMFVAGPFAGLLTQSGKFAMIKSKLDKKGKTTIKNFNSHWVFKNGKAVTKDVAIRTTKNLVAVKGTINLSSLKYKDMNIAVLNNQRCVKYNQLLTGDLKKGTVDIKESKVETFLSPVTSLLKGAVSLFGGNKKCKPFYGGKVKW